MGNEALDGGDGLQHGRGSDLAAGAEQPAPHDEGSQRPRFAGVFARGKVVSALSPLEQQREGRLGLWALPDDEFQGMGVSPANRGDVGESGHVSAPARRRCGEDEVGADGEQGELQSGGVRRGEIHAGDGADPGAFRRELLRWRNVQRRAGRSPHPDGVDEYREEVGQELSGHAIRRANDLSGGIDTEVHAGGAAAELLAGRRDRDNPGKKDRVEGQDAAGRDDTGAGGGG